MIFRSVLNTAKKTYFWLNFYKNGYKIISLLIQFKLKWKKNTQKMLIVIELAKKIIHNKLLQWNPFLFAL